MTASLFTRRSKTKEKMLPSGECRVCGLNASIVSVERLSNGGTLMMAIHQGEIEHKWTEHPSIFEPRKVPNPILMTCPKCGKQGRVNEYHPYKRRPEIVAYYIAHEQIHGYWGKKSKIRRLKRCYITKLTHRNTVLKRLGRYIPCLTINTKKSSKTLGQRLRSGRRSKPNE
jgi:hypothetical protein